MIYQRIYHFAEPVRPNLKPSSPQGAASQGFRCDKGALALLRSCSQVNAEAAAVFYGANTMTFDVVAHDVEQHKMLWWAFGDDSCRACEKPGVSSLLQLEPWLHCIGPTNLRRLRSLEIRLNEENVDFMHHTKDSYWTLGGTQRLTHPLEKEMPTSMHALGNRLVPAFDTLVKGRHQLRHLRFTGKLPTDPATVGRAYIALLFDPADSQVAAALERLVACGRHGRRPHEWLEFSCEGWTDYALHRVAQCQPDVEAAGNTKVSTACDVERIRELGRCMARYHRLQQADGDGLGGVARNASAYGAQAAATLSAAKGYPAEAAARLAEVLDTRWESSETWKGQSWDRCECKGCEDETMKLFRVLFGF